MYQEQRLSKMLALLEDKGQLAAKDMVDYFQVSKDTIRRDFSILSERKLVQRTHGGIIPLENSRQIPSFNDRVGQLNQEKKAIAHKALDFLKPNQVNFFDVSTVVLKLAQQVQQPMTIFSHSLDNAIMLSDQEQVAFHLLGGKFYPRNRFYYALNEAELLRDISFDLAFIGAAGLKNGQISFEDQEDAYLKKLALKQAKTKILLAEQAKVKKESTYILGNISDFDYWITDQKPSPELEALLAGKVTIIY